MRKPVLRRLMIFGTVSIFIIVYFIFTFVTYAVRLSNLKEAENLLITELREKVEENVEMTDELKKLNNKDYLANYAREHYMYTADGEIIIKMIDQINESEEIIKKERNTVAIMLTGATSVIVLLLIRKKLKK